MCATFASPAGAASTSPYRSSSTHTTTRPERSERATKAGAVNTLQFDGDDVFGDNTDGAGLVRDIRDGFGFAIAGARVVLMGAGGAARGALLPLLAERPARIAIVNRTVVKAEALATCFASHAAGVSLHGGGYGDVAGDTFDLVINATSASLADALPPLPANVFARAALAYDMVYGARAKAFIAYALAQGAARAVDGLGMLVEQAAESFFLWRGVRPATASGNGCAARARRGSGRAKGGIMVQRLRGQRTQ